VDVTLTKVAMVILATSIYFMCSTYCNQYLAKFIFFMFQILMILFAVLRKRAWNYGSIALVQKREER
jgi:hypothetical protein